jgi:hypothetical protein
MIRQSARGGAIRLFLVFSRVLSESFFRGGDASFFAVQNPTINRPSADAIRCNAYAQIARSKTRLITAAVAGFPS